MYMYVYIYTHICKHICMSLVCRKVSHWHVLLGNYPRIHFFADGGFLGLKNWEFLASFRTKYSMCSAKRASQAGVFPWICHHKTARSKLSKSTF